MKQVSYFHIPPETMRMAAKGMGREAEKLRCLLECAAKSPFARQIEAVTRRLDSL